jgi:hypothetical protein
MSLTPDMQLMRKGLFTPCTTREELAQWLRLYLKIRLPDRVVSDESNFSPFEMVWELYDRLRRNDLEGWSEVMVYASRFSGKTLGAAILEVLTVLHMPRNIAHMAAIENQAKKAQEYVKRFFNYPILREFVYGDNAREVKVVAHIHNETGVPLTDREFNKLQPTSQTPYRRHEQYIKIVICNMAGANGDHVELMVVDEVDVIPRQNIPAYHQAKGGIPVGSRGLTAMTLFTSTRKSRIGLVQQEIDDAARSGLVLKHWNVVDVTEPCKPSRYLPEQPKATYYVNDGEVRHITEEAYSLLAPVERQKWYAAEGYAGCKTCPLFPACKGRLATHQSGTVGDFKDGGTALLVKISPDVSSKFRSNTPEFITTEFLCRKPDTSGLVYPRLKDDVHFKSPMEIAEMVAGRPMPQIGDKAALLKMLYDKGARFYTGMDFGFGHLFAVATIAVWGNIAFVVDAIGQSRLELDDKIAVCEHLKQWNCSIFGDPEAPSDITTFKRKGYKMVEWDKFQGSVKAGIEIVRMKIHTNSVGPTLFFMSGDPMIAALFDSLTKYRFTTDAAGNFTEEPEDDGDDFADALRYVLMNVFARKGAIKATHTPEAKASPPPDQAEAARRAHQNWMSDHVKSLTGESTSDSSSGPTTTIKRGGFLWDG